MEPRDGLGMESWGVMEGDVDVAASGVSRSPVEWGH